MDGISFSIEPTGNLLLPNHIVNSLNNFRQNKSKDTEAGGILLGRQFDDKPDVVVDELTTPFKTDRRSRHRFYRSKAHHDFAVKRWKESEGICLYQGLWHTHPEANPSPSSIDYHDWTKAMNKGQFEGENLFFIIVGINQICCWQRINKHTFTQL